jgi:hypothetical protein
MGADGGERDFSSPQGLTLRISGVCSPITQTMSPTHGWVPTAGIAVRASSAVQPVAEGEREAARFLIGEVLEIDLTRSA